MTRSTGPYSVTHATPKFAVLEELKRYWAASGAKRVDDDVAKGKPEDHLRPHSPEDDEGSSTSRTRSEEESSSESDRPRSKSRSTAELRRRRSVGSRGRRAAASHRRSRTRTRTRSPPSERRRDVMSRSDYRRKSAWVEASRSLACVVADSMVGSRPAIESQHQVAILRSPEGSRKGECTRGGVHFARSSPQSLSNTPSSSPSPRRRRSRRRSRSKSVTCEKKRPAAPDDASPASPKKRKRNSKWDMVCNTEEVLNLRKLLPGGCAKKHRECYIGNLAMGQVTEQSLRDIFKTMFDALPEFRYTYPDVTDPIVSTLFPPQGHGCFCFVEFMDQVLASTAIQMSGFELMGRPVRIGRPQGYIGMEMGEERAPLCVQALRDACLLPQRTDIVSLIPQATGANTRLRQLYVGNLVVGHVAEKDIVELFTPVCEQLPEYNPEQGPAITKIHWSNTGMYCFVDFQNPHIADQILLAFDSAHLCGRPLRLGRPSGYDHAAFQSNGLHLQPSAHTITPAVVASTAVVASNAFQAGAAAAANLSTL